jgi:hypothetical protein
MCDGGATPRTLIDSFSVPTLSSIIQSNGTDTGAFAAGVPLSMTLQSEFDLKPFGQLVNRGVDRALAPVAEPST